MENTEEKEETPSQGLYQASPTKSQPTNLVAKIKNLSGSKKILIFGGGGIGLGFIALIIFVLILGQYMLPNFMQIVQDYAFSSITLTSNEATQNVIDQNLALEAAPPVVSAEQAAAGESSYANLESSFAQDSPSLWDTINNIRPSNIIDNFKSSNNISFNYSKNHFFSEPQLQSIDINGQSFAFDNTTGFFTHVPIISDFIKANDFANFWANASPALSDAIDAQALGTIPRSIVTRELFMESGGSLTGWLLYKFKTRSAQEDPSVTEAQQIAQDTAAGDNSAPGPAIVDGNNSEAQQAEQSLANETTTEVAQELKTGNPPSTFLKYINESATNGVLGDFLKYTNPIYAIGMPVCLIYESSIVNSGPGINNTINEQTNLYDGLQSQASQEIKGSTASNPYHGALATAVSGTNNNLGNLSQSDAEILAGGGTINTANSIHPEAAPNGSYQQNIITALLPHDKFIQTIANGVFQFCPIITNVGVSIGVGALSVLTQVAATFSGIGVAADAAGPGAETVVDDAATNLVDKGIFQTLKDYLFNDVTINSAGKTTTTSRSGILYDALIKGPIKGIFSKTGIATLGTTVALSLLAKNYVVSNTSLVNSGVATGPALTNEALSGALLQASEVNRSNNFGRPLTKSEMVQTQVNAISSLGNTKSNSSLASRYISLSNPYSLLSRLAVSVESIKNVLTIKDFTNYLDEIFNPLRIFNNIVSIFNYSPALAASNANPINQNFGIVDFGWSNQELQRMHSNSSFYPLENQQILTQSGQESQIAKTYAVCFGYSYSSKGQTFNPTAPNSKLTISTTAQIGSLLANGSIQRDSNGYVVANQGLCSPQNLGYNNPQFGHNVFRFRLAMLYDTTANNLCNASYVSSTDNSKKCY